MMTELERRALMGDPAAQRECTEKGILLGCPFCGGKVKLDEYDFYMFCCDKCGAGITFAKEFDDGTAGDCTKEESIAKWNTRAAPPIGRCLDCKKQSFNQNTGNTWCTLKKPRRKVSPLGFCSDFEPKEREENGSTID